MTWTQTQLSDEARNLADATGSGRWTSTNILRYADVAYRREWRGILNEKNTYRQSLRSVTSDSSGIIAISTLSTATERLYRILGVAEGLVPYREIRFRDTPILDVGSGTIGTGQSWVRAGDNLQIYPARVSAMSIWVNHIPKAISSLGANDAVVFPEDYELILALEMAALMLVKGGAETDAAADLKALADEMRGDLYQDVARLSTNPLLMDYSDDPSEWGGN